MLNKLIIKKIWLKKDELPILVIRKSAWCWLGYWLMSFGLLVVAFFLMYFLFIYGIWGVIAFLVVVIIALLIFLRAYWEFYFTVWVLTNLRLIDIYQQGFFHREKTETFYDGIAEAHAQKHGFWGSLLNLGDIYLTLKDSHVRLILRKIRGYERALSEIIMQQDNYRHNYSRGRGDQSGFILAKLKKKLGERKFNELIGE